MAREELFALIFEEVQTPSFPLEQTAPGLEAAGNPIYRRYPAGVTDDLAKRLEMLLVLQWLDEGRPEDGTVALSVSTAAVELGLESERSGILTIMAALGDLEERKLVRVALEGPVTRNPRVTLAPELRQDAARLFGAGESSGH